MGDTESELAVSCHQARFPVCGLGQQPAHKNLRPTICPACRIYCGNSDTELVEMSHQWLVQLEAPHGHKWVQQLWLSRSHSNIPRWRSAFKTEEAFAKNPSENVLYISYAKFMWYTHARPNPQEREWELCNLRTTHPSSLHRKKQTLE